MKRAERKSRNKISKFQGELPEGKKELVLQLLIINLKFDALTTFVILHLLSCQREDSNGNEMGQNAIHKSKIEKKEINFCLKIRN